MNAVVSCLLCFYIIYHVKLQGGEAASYTNGFPSRLVYYVSFRIGPSTRLIPEMNFNCNGIITGYTAALREQNGTQDPLIQVWRENTSQPGSYYKTSPGIAIDKALCVGGLTEVSSDLFHCNLNWTTTRVTVQPGDILGLELPNGDNDDIRLAFATVSRGPTNYVWERLSMYSGTLFRRDLVSRELPQITLEVGSGSNCITGFPDIPVSTVGGCTTTTSMTTLLIPEMNFTCNASIVGFIVAGRNLNDDPHPRVQIWRKSSSQNSAVCNYYPMGNFSVHIDVCAAGSARLVTFWCILYNNFQVSVQPGDIFGLELPATHSDKILFISGGPRNYIFNQLDSNTSVNLSHQNRNSTAQQLPQIMLSITSAHCLSGFPGEAIFEEYGQRIPADRSQQITRLFPNLKFGCFGTIVRVVAAVRDTSGDQAPKIQIWREDKTRPGLYHRTSSDVQIVKSNPPCYRYTISNRIFECTLREDYHISVQPGDFLGLEIPSVGSGDDLVVYFKPGGSANLVFQHQLDSILNLFTEPHTIMYEEPQINFLVILDENADTCPEVSTAPPGPLTTAATTTTPDEIVSTVPSVSYNTSVSPVTATICTQASNGNNLTTTMPDTTESPADTATHTSTTSDSTTTTDNHTTGVTTTHASTTFDSTTTSDTTESPEVHASTIFDSTTTYTGSSAVITAHATIESSNSTATIQDTRSALAVSNSATTVIAGSVIGGIIVILLLMAVILLTMVLIQLRKRKQYTLNSAPAHQLENPLYDGASYSSGVLEPETGYKDDTSTSCDHTKFNVKRQAASLHTDDQNLNITYEALEMQHYEMNGPTLATHEEPYIYWEPAKTVNDLHKQMSSNKYRELPRQQVEITKALGSGQFGVVSMGVWQSPTGAMEVAVKQLHPGVTETEKIRFLQEAAINGQFRHPNVVQLMGVVTTGEPAMIVLELLSNGDLRNFLIKHQIPPKLESGGVDKHLLLQFCQHVASGMSYLASKAFVHRDLAARNILVSKNRICKISDFGMSRDLLDEDYYVSNGGMIPVKWTAPEAIHYKKYSTASDVWSFGCVMYEIWSLGHKPFESYNNPEVIKMIDKGYCLPPPPGLSKELYKIMIQCWQPERSRRPTFPQLVELLSRADFELFLWEDEDLRNSDPRVKEIGVSLEITMGLYPELQKTYLRK